MTTINLKDYYPWYTQDEFIDVTDEIAAELQTGTRYEQAHERKMRYNKVHSIDAKDGTEATASIHISCSPSAILEMKERHCQLCQALNALPEAQGRRIEAHYLQGKSQKEIAEAEGVTKEAVSISITKGLVAMKKNMGKPGWPA